MNQIPLLGRDSEKAVLNALLAGITSGGGALLVTGEPGIGKSALVDYAAWRARAAGFTVLTCVGAEVHWLDEPTCEVLAFIATTARSPGPVG